MCGIAGIYNSKRTPSDQNHAQERMLSYMNHRGPDDRGMKVFRNCIIGQTRLSIIDTSANARQPFTDENEEISIAVNGEIYNFQPLKKELIRKGYLFRSSSDSEVVLHGFKEWGTDLFSKLQGMFAISIYDRRNDALILCRDRIGIKPLYYVHDQNEVIFASEIGAILSSRLINKTFNVQALYPYLFLGYMPSGLCPLDKINSVEPGCFLVIQNDRVEENEYWRMNFSKKIRFDNDEDLIAETRRLLENSIKAHIQSDVPLGIFLSGGIDSTVLAGLACNQMSEVKTLSVGFDQGPRRLNELDIAKKSSKYFGTDHSEFIMTGSDVRSRIKKIIHHIDSPSFDGVNTFIVSEMAKESGLTVALSGLGGDELFGGYDIFGFYPKYLPYIPAWSHLPKYLKSFAIKQSSKLINDSSRRNKLDRLKDINDASSFYALNRASSWPNEFPDLVEDEFHEYNPERELFKIFDVENSDSWKSLQEREIRNYVTSRLLRDTDSMSMAHSLEVRVPLLDDNLIAHMFSISSMKNSSLGWPKKLLIKATEDLIPNFVLNRKKQGFQLPMDYWIRNELKDIVDDVFSENSTKNRGLFKPKGMKQIIQKFNKNEVTYDVVWKFVILELWLREHEINIA